MAGDIVVHLRTGCADADRNFEDPRMVHCDHIDLVEVGVAADRPGLRSRLAVRSLEHLHRRLGADSVVVRHTDCGPRIAAAGVVLVRETHNFDQVEGSSDAARHNRPAGAGRILLVDADRGCRTGQRVGQRAYCGLVWMSVIRRAGTMWAERCQCMCYPEKRYGCIRNRCQRAYCAD